jgi:alcohol dehydrogenase class IV
MNLTGNWNYPTTIKFGNGRVKELARHCKHSGITAPLLVTDPTLASFPMVQAAVEQLKGAGLRVEVFSAIKPNPVAANVADGVAALRAGKHDGVVCFGGGSALDAGKVIAFMAGQTRPMWDFEDVGEPTPRAFCQTSVCRRRQGRAVKLAAPGSLPMRRPTPKKSSSIR